MKKFDWKKFNKNLWGVIFSNEKEKNDFYNRAVEYGYNCGFLKDWFGDEINKKYMCICFHGDICEVERDDSFAIIEWSDYMGKEFTQDDLKDYMLVVTRNGNKYIVTKGATTLGGEGSSWNDLSDYKDFKCCCYLKNVEDCDIVEVYSEPICGNPIALRKDSRTLLYKEETVEKMTLKQVCEALGKNIELIPEEDK